MSQYFNCGLSTLDCPSLARISRQHGLIVVCCYGNIGVVSFRFCYGNIGVVSLCLLLLSLDEMFIMFNTFSWLFASCPKCIVVVLSLLSLPSPWCSLRQHNNCAPYLRIAGILCNKDDEKGNEKFPGFLWTFRSDMADFGTRLVNVPKRLSPK